MAWLNPLFRNPDKIAQTLAPDAPFFAVGDVHGCDEVLARLLDKLDAINPDAPIVVVGDVVDRGPFSAQALERLFSARDDGRIMCLMGNHEAMMLDFLDDPMGDGWRWLRFGGVETMASFDVDPAFPDSDEDDIRLASERLRAVLGDEREAWLRALPRRWSSGNVWVVHAAMDPDLAPDGQPEDVLTWGHPDFLKRTRRDGQWVVHGHTIVKAPVLTPGRIAIDTGAWRTGRLTAVHVSHGAAAFIEA